MTRSSADRFTGGTVKSFRVPEAGEPLRTATSPLMAILPEHYEQMKVNRSANQAPTSTSDPSHRNSAVLGIGRRTASVVLGQQSMSNTSVPTTLGASSPRCLYSPARSCSTEDELKFVDENDILYYSEKGCHEHSPGTITSDAELETLQEYEVERCIALKDDAAAWKELCMNLASQGSTSQDEIDRRRAAIPVWVNEDPNPNIEKIIRDRMEKIRKQRKERGGNEEK